MELLEYLKRESNGQHTEFRLVVLANGSCYIHVMNRDCETLNFDLYPAAPLIPATLMRSEPPASGPHPVEICPCDICRNVMNQITQTSDIRLKENIVYLSDSSEILNLKPASYNMKGGTKKQFGFIAQDVEETKVSNIVFENERGIKSLAYNQVIPLLVHQIQILNSRIANIEQSVNK